MDIASRTVVISNFPTTWLSAGPLLVAKVASLLEKFGRLTEPPFAASSPCKLGSGDSGVVAYATFDEQDAAQRAIKCLHGSDNRTGDEERLANYAPPNERQKYYVQIADWVPSKETALQSPQSDERPPKAAKFEQHQHFLRVEMPRLNAEMPTMDDLSPLLQKQLLIIAQCQLPPHSADQRPSLLAPLQITEGNERRLTVVLDLDGTLVECRPVPCVAPEMQEVENGATMPPLTVVLEGKAHKVHFRPKAQVFLATVAKLFEIVVFTASIQSYADQVLDHLDPEGKRISARLYRQHCTPVPCGPGQVVFLKDMSLLGRPVERVVLVDDSPISHMMNPDNGIVVSPWSADQTADSELLALLLSLRECQRHASESGSATEYLVQRYGLRSFFDNIRAQAAAAFRAFCEFSASGEQLPGNSAEDKEKDHSPTASPQALQQNLPTPHVAVALESSAPDAMLAEVPTEAPACPAANSEATTEASAADE